MSALRADTQPAVMSVPGVGPRVLVACLVGCYVLLPLDRGFPTVPLFGRPLNSAIAATIVVLAALTIQSRGAVLAYLIEPYSVIQSFYACVLVASAFRAPSLPSALHWSALYFSTFVLNYAILRYVTRRYGTRWLSLVVVGVGLGAAAVAIVQAVPGIRLPLYDAWFENYFDRLPEDYALPTVRAAGTMNNPIVFCVLMVLVVPYALDVKRVGARSLALFVLMFAAGLTGSRTLLVVLGPFALGALAVYRWRAVRALPAVSVGVILLLASLGWVTPRGQDSRMAFLTQRFGLTAGAKTALDQAPRDVLSRASARSGRARHVGTPGAPPPTQAELSAALGISLRQAVVKAGLREMIYEWGPGTWLVGRGTFAAMSLGRTILPWYTTVDNVFLSVLYERGLIGLALFLAAFVTFVFTTRSAATHTVHWFAPIALAAAGVLFCWDAYSTFNILVVGSMALTMRQHERLITVGAYDDDEDA